MSKKEAIKYCLYVLITYLTLAGIVFILVWTIGIPIIFWTTRELTNHEFAVYAIGEMISIPITLILYGLDRFLKWFWDVEL